MSARLQRYRRFLDISYTFGISPTLELLAACPERAEQVLLHGGQGGEGVAKMRALCSASGVPVVVNPRGIRQVSARFFPVVGIFRKFSRPMRAGADHVLLFRPQYGGNVGTVIRTMVGFGIVDLAVVRPAPDLMSPDIVRASMGAVFRLRWAEFTDLDAYSRAFGSHSLYCFTPDGELPVERLVPRQPFSLVFGSEGAGLPTAVRRRGKTVRIGHRPAIDSLNLGVAVGIALHECARFI